MDLQYWPTIQPGRCWDILKSLERMHIWIVLKFSPSELFKNPRGVFYSNGKAGRCPPLLDSVAAEKSFPCVLLPNKTCLNVHSLRCKTVCQPQPPLKRPTFNYNVMSTWSWQAFTGKEAGTCGEVRDWLKGSFRTLNISPLTPPPPSCMHAWTHGKKRGGGRRRRRERYPFSFHSQAKQHHPALTASG